MIIKFSPIFSTRKFLVLHADYIKYYRYTFFFLSLSFCLFPRSLCQWIKHWFRKLNCASVFKFLIRNIKCYIWISDVKRERRRKLGLLLHWFKVDNFVCTYFTMSRARVTQTSLSFSHVKLNCPHLQIILCFAILENNRWYSSASSLYAHV